MRRLKTGKELGKIKSKEKISQQTHLFLELKKRCQQSGNEYTATGGKEGPAKGTLISW